MTSARLSIGLISLNYLACVISLGQGSDRIGKRGRFQAQQNRASLDNDGVLGRATLDSAFWGQKKKKRVIGLSDQNRQRTGTEALGRSCHNRGCRPGSPASQRNMATGSSTTAVSLSWLSVGSISLAVYRDELAIAIMVKGIRSGKGWSGMIGLSRRQRPNRRQMLIASFTLGSFSGSRVSFGLLGGKERGLLPG